MAWLETGNDDPLQAGFGGDRSPPETSGRAGPWETGSGSCAGYKETTCSCTHRLQQNRTHRFWTLGLGVLSRTHGILLVQEASQTLGPPALSALEALGSQQGPQKSLTETLAAHSWDTQGTHCPLMTGAAAAPAQDAQACYLSEVGSGAR